MKSRFCDWWLDTKVTFATELLSVLKVRAGKRGKNKHDLCRSFKHLNVKDTFTILPQNNSQVPVWRLKHFFSWRAPNVSDQGQNPHDSCMKTHLKLRIVLFSAKFPLSFDTHTDMPQYSRNLNRKVGTCKVRAHERECRTQTHMSTEPGITLNNSEYSLQTDPDLWVISKL